MTVHANQCPGGAPSSLPDSYWPEAAHVFPVERFDAFLLWAAKRGASDISFQTGAPAFIEVDGRLARATGAALDGVALGSLCARIFDATGEGILRGGRAIDCSHAVAEARGVFRRFRCNLAPVQAAGGFAVNITLRVLPGAPPSFEELGIEDEIVEAWDLRRGLTLVTGVPGSGKSTLLAAGTRRLLERGAGRIQSYEAPIEFVFDHIEGDGALMSSSEIPRHFQSFADGLRSSLRRRPAAVIVGEARDRETVEAVVRAADYGIAVYSTAHTIGVAATIRRLLAEFPAGERAERGAALIDAMNLAVTQVLAPNPAGSDRSTSEPGRAHGAARMAGLRRPPQGRTAGAAANRLAGADRGRARGDRQQSCRRGRARLRRGPDRTGRAPALPRGCRGRRWRRRQRRQGWGLRARSPIGGSRHMLRRRFHGPFRSALARHHAPGAVLHDRRAPAGPADGVAVRAGLVDDGGRLAGDRGVPHRRGARLPFPGRAPGAPRRKRWPPPRPSRGAVAALCGFWLMAGSALMPSAASAEFRYVAPSAVRAGVTVLDEAGGRGERNGATLAQTLKRLAPPSLRLRYDRRVDAAKAVVDEYPDWQSLLFGEGLAAVRRGGELHIRPAGLPPGAVELATADRGHGVWRVEAGDTLRAVLERWGTRAGVEVLFLTDRRYRLHRGQAFEGAFIDAVRTLFFALSHLPHPPAGEFTAGGKSLAVTHRAPQIPANGGKP